MSEMRSIYCRLDKAAVCAEMSGRFSDLRIEGAPEEWTSMTAAGSGGTLTLNALTFQYTNDEYSNLHYKTCMFLWDIETLSDDEKEALSAEFGRKKLILGIVADPAFDVDARFDAAVFAVARRLEGLIVTGTAFLDSAGGTIAEFD